MEHHFNVEDAEKYGIAAAILLYNLRFWIKKNKTNNRNCYDGYYWTYNSIRSWAELFPYMTVSKIRTALTVLEDCGVILTANYNKAGYDKTTWYTVKNDESMCQKSQMDVSEIANGFATGSKPIPDINTDSKPDNTASKLAASAKYLMNIPVDDMKYMVKEYSVTARQVEDKAEDLYNWAESKGKKYKDYKLFLYNALKKDFGKRNSNSGMTL